MWNRIKSRMQSLPGAAGIAVLALAMVVAGCGGDKETSKSEVTVRTTTKSRPVETVEPVVDTVSAPVASEVTAVTEPETQREVTYDVAEAAFLEGRYAEAVELFTYYTGRRSENPWGFYMLGLSAWKAGDHDSAEAAFEQALTLDPKHVKSMLNLSRVLLDTNRPQDALAKIADALAIDPESGVAFRLEGRAFYQQGKSEEAVASYRRAIQIDDQDAWAMNNLALVLIEAERYEEALPPLARAVELESDAAIFQNNLGMALECTGHFRAAEAAYQSAVELDASHDIAAANLDRISGVLEDPAIAPVDLAAIAQGFADGIAKQDASIVLSRQFDAGNIDPPEDTPASSEPDTTGTDEQP